MSYVSKNRLEGSLAETPLDALFAPCSRALFTGTITIEARAGKGEVVLRAGGIDSARFGTLEGDAALAKMRTLTEGSYVLAQRLPNLKGELGSAAQFEGRLADIPLVKIMRHCEQHALSCDIVVISDFDRGEIQYRAGDVTSVQLNGSFDPDAIIRITNLPKARFRVSAPPLDLGIGGWPVVGPEPTAPFRVQGKRKSAPKRQGTPGSR